MKKKIKIPIPKNFLKDSKFKVKLVPHSWYKTCYCADCIEQRVKNEFLKENIKCYF
jgi:ribosomal protein L34E